MKILAIDTALAACSVAVWNTGVLCARRFELRARGHAEAIMPMVGACVDEAGIDYLEFDCFAVSVGPGTYTGLRIGHAAIRGLAIAAHRPVIGISCLEAVAHAAVRAVPDAPTDMAVILTTKRADRYIQLFRRAVARDAPQALTPHAIAQMLPSGPLFLAGDAAASVAAGLDRHDMVVTPGAGLPDAADIAELAAERAKRDGLPQASDFPRPLYLRAPNVTMSDGNTGLRPRQ